MGEKIAPFASWMERPSEVASLPVVVQEAQDPWKEEAGIGKEEVERER